VQFFDILVRVDRRQKQKKETSYDTTKKAIQDIVDIPDRLLNLFIRLCLKNNGVILESERQSLFQKLKDDEIERMQKAVQKGYKEGV